MLPLQLAGETVPVQVAGVVQRFPGPRGDDGRRRSWGARHGDQHGLLRAALARTSSGSTSRPTGSDAVAAALERPPFRTLDTTVRSEVEAQARRDPLAHGTLLALIGRRSSLSSSPRSVSRLAVRADLRDDRGEHYDLEAQGSSPTFLRRVVRVRAASLSVVGLAAGIATGLASLPS